MYVNTSDLLKNLLVFISLAGIKFAKQLTDLKEDLRCVKEKMREFSITQIEPYI